MEKIRKTAILVGYGSIGKRHASILNELVSMLCIVDPKESERDQAAENYPNAMIFNSLDDAFQSGEIDLSAAVAVIATWGPSHAELFKRLADQGVKRVLCEKPLASSVKLAQDMCQRAERDGIRLSVNHYIRYSNLAAELEKFCVKNNLGLPVSMVVDGGAGCLVTNGIHWIDFAMHLFGSAPELVLSTARGERINPRSHDLEIYGGSAIWSFSQNREAIFSMSNRSSISLRCRVHYRNATVELADDLIVCIFRRDMSRVEKFPAITRTGPASELLYNSLLPGVADFKGCMKAALDELLDGKDPLRCTGQMGFVSVSAAIGALISGRERKPVDLPIDFESAWGEEEWPIS
jgi:predicted dehydrogenase